MTAQPAVGGDMTTGTASAHLETLDEIATTPTDIEVDVNGSAPIVPEVIAPTWQTQHAKVLRFEVSIGKDDDARTIEQFEADVKAALASVANNVTLSGGYYIIDGKVCLPPDYDPATRNRKPGTNPPSWAGGPSGANKGYQPPIPTDESKEDTVRRLATNVGKQMEDRR